MSAASGSVHVALVALVLLLRTSAAGAATITVPDDFTTIQAALDAAVAGDDVLVKDTPGPYVEQISFPAGGAPGAWITLQAFPGHQPVIDGTGLLYAPLVTIDSKSWVRLVGFDVFLDGSLLRRGGHRVEKERIVADLSIGLVVAIHDRVSLTYVHTLRTPEFEGQVGGDQFGSVSLAISW